MSNVGLVASQRPHFNIFIRRAFGFDGRPDVFFLFMLDVCPI